ncbi:MAG: GxxExxY protein [Rhodospirillales bacterium]|nr:GxxExxY protein [Rhodospirillales bacterium]MCB9995969.1 GxxExxY protein [Rhodospirillales bacterium]
MDTNKHELFYKDDVFEIVGCAMTVLNSVGHGFSEKMYENAMVIELTDRDIDVHQQQSFEVIYKNQKIGTYIPDIIAENKIVIEIKTIDRITDIERGQVINYLKVTGYKVGIILNFKHARLEWERIVL